MHGTVLEADGAPVSMMQLPSQVPPPALAPSGSALHSTTVDALAPASAIAPFRRDVPLSSVCKADVPWGQSLELDPIVPMQVQLVTSEEDGGQWRYKC